MFKVFGDDPQEALALVRQGLSKQEVLARTGQSIGVFDAHLSIEAGEIFVVMGLSGSGKSTLVRLLNLLIEPSAGRILVDGVDIAQLPDAQLRALRRKDISMVFPVVCLDAPYDGVGQHGLGPGVGRCRSGSAPDTGSPGAGAGGPGRVGR